MSSKASRDVASYKEKRDAALMRARLLREQRLVATPSDTREGESASAPIVAARELNVEERVTDLEHALRAQKKETGRLETIITNLLVRLVALEGAGGPGGHTTAEGQFISKKPRAMRHTLSPPPMDFSLDPYADATTVSPPESARMRPAPSHQPAASAHLSASNGRYSSTHSDEPKRVDATRLTSPPESARITRVAPSHQSAAPTHVSASYGRHSSAHTIEPKRDESPPPMNFDFDPYEPAAPTKTPIIKPKRRNTTRTVLKSPPLKAMTAQYSSTISFDEIPISPAKPSMASHDSMEAEHAAPERLFPCNSCGRRFRLESLKTHTAACVKVFKSKRKVFKVEFVDPEDLVDMSKPFKSKRAPKVVATAVKAPTDKPVAKWRQDRARLQRDLLQKKSGKGVEIIEVADSRTQCPHCSRMFSELVAERHIPACMKIISKPTMLLRKTCKF